MIISRENKNIGIFPKYGLLFSILGSMSKYFSYVISLHFPTKWHSNLKECSFSIRQASTNVHTPFSSIMLLRKRILNIFSIVLFYSTGIPLEQINTFSRVTYFFISLYSGSASNITFRPLKKLL